MSSDPLPWDRRDLAFKGRPPHPGLFTQARSYYQSIDHPWLKDENFRVSSPRYVDGRSIGTHRENHGLFGRSPSSDSNGFTRITPQHDKSGGGVNDDHIFDRELCLGPASWKPLKLARGLSSSRILKPESEEAATLDVSAALVGKEIPVMPPLPSDEDPPRKKQRLGWGQGLAIFEKKRVEGSVDEHASNTAKAASDDTGPEVMGGVGCIPRATMCSAISSSQPGLEVKPCDKEANKDACCLDDSADCGIQNCSNESIVNLDPLKDGTISILTSLIGDLLQPDDACSGDSFSTRHASLTKLLALKEVISKEFEKTEYEIDSHENELKTLKVVDIDNCLDPLASKCGKSSSSLNVISTSDLELTRCSFDAEESPYNICGHGRTTCLNEGMSSDGKGGNNLVDIIMVSNKGAAEEASQVFARAWACDPLQVDIWEPDYISSCRRNNDRVRERIFVSKHFLKFKEHALALKYRAFHRLWKEDMCVLLIKSERAKLHQRFKLRYRTWQCGPQRHRSAVRTRLTLPAGNTTLVPTTQIIEYTNKLPPNSQIKIYRNNLKVPSLMLDENDRRHSRFVTYNRLIEDPTSLEKERTMINPWTKEETEVFLENLSAFGKDFTKISSFLDRKTSADCVEFYYKNHKSESFIEVKKQLKLRKRSQCLHTSTYLNTSGKKWNRGSNTSLLDMLGAASALVAQDNDFPKNRQKFARKSILGRYQEKARAAEISCLTTASCLSEKWNYAEEPEIPRSIDEEDSFSDEGSSELDSADWTDKEKTVFVKGLSMYGKDFMRVSCFVGTRSRDQCKIFFSKARKCLSLDVILPGSSNEGNPISDTNGGRSDIDDACQSFSKVDADITQSSTNTSSVGFDRAGNTFEGKIVTRVGMSHSSRSTEDLNDDELRVGMSHSSRSTKDLNDDELRCNELKSSREIAEDFIGRESGICGDEPVSTVSNPVITGSTDSEQLTGSGIDKWQRVKVERDSDSFSFSFTWNKDVDGDGLNHNAKMAALHALPFSVNYKHRRATEHLPFIHEKPQDTPMRRENLIAGPSNKVLKHEEVKRLADSMNKKLVPHDYTPNVKFFGKILSNLSSLQKPVPSPKLDDKLKSSTGMKASSSGKNGAVYESRLENSNSTALSSLEDNTLRLKSYSFCNGNRIQTGCHQGSLAGASFYAGKDNNAPITSGFLVEYPKAYKKTLAEGKQLHSFIELQKRKGFEPLQQRLGPNRVGSEEILVGQGKVSDAVSALKMHYSIGAHDSSR